MNAPDAVGVVTKSILKTALADLGLAPGDVVAFHTSLSAFGHIENGADTVIDAILETIGPSGTALAPTLTFDERWGPECPPVFDVRRTPSVTGRTPEVFRLRPDAVRSLHPTHSWAAIGPRARELTTGHEDSPTPCGPESPLGRLARDPRGKILLAGVTLKSCTFFHHCEEVAGVPYHLQKRPTHVVMTDTTGAVIERDLYLHCWHGLALDFTKPEADLLRLGVMKKAFLIHAPLSLLNANRTAEFIIDNLRRNAEYFKT